MGQSFSHYAIETPLIFWNHGYVVPKTYEDLKNADCIDIRWKYISTRKNGSTILWRRLNGDYVEFTAVDDDMITKLRGKLSKRVWSIGEEMSGLKDSVEHCLTTL